MQRNWNLIRDILLAVEALPTYREVLRPKEVEDYDDAEVSYHIALLIEAELITGKCKTQGENIFCLAENLTWQGHEFLDSIREKDNWQHFKKMLADKSIALSFEAIKTVAMHYLKQQIL